MTDIEKQLHETLSRIAEQASAALNGGARSQFGLSVQEHRCEPHTDVTDGDVPGCSIKSVPARLLAKAADVAGKINPANAVIPGPTAGLGAEAVLDPQFLVVLVSKYWGPAPRRLTVSFMETTAADLRARILRHMNAWTRTGCIEFVETRSAGDVRISRGPGGYWSYLGTDIRLIPQNRPTMNLQNFTMNTPETEFVRVVRHEAGHTLGFPHEHMRRELVARIDPQKAYAYFLSTQGWSRQMVDQQVLTPLDQASVIGTAADQDSIMCYQLPGSITRDGLPIRGGRDINQTDYAFAGRIYPRVVKDMGLPAKQVSQPAPAETEDWPESEDVETVE
jgi:hypothetical protein